MQFGRYYEEFEVGETYKHWPGKTVTEYDDHLFCLLTMNHHPLHLDAHYAEGSTDFGKNVVVGNYIYSLLLGMSVPDVSGKAIANLEIESLKHVKPTFHGDTIYGETTVLDKTESRSKDDRGVVHCRDPRLQPGRRRRVRVPTQGDGAEAVVRRRAGRRAAGPPGARRQLGGQHAPLAQGVPETVDEVEGLELDAGDPAHLASRRRRRPASSRPRASTRSRGCRRSARAARGVGRCPPGSRPARAGRSPRAPHGVRRRGRPRRAPRAHLAPTTGRCLARLPRRTISSRPSSSWTSAPTQGTREVGSKGPGNTSSSLEDRQGLTLRALDDRGGRAGPSAHEG